eukprot:1498763-Pleurochrysis_carterae.AAC.5
MCQHFEKFILGRGPCTGSPIAGHQLGTVSQFVTKIEGEILHSGSTTTQLWTAGRCCECMFQFG